MNYNNTKPAMSPAVLIILCCISCAVLTSMSSMCPEEYKGMCVKTASGINCLLCWFVIFKMFGVF